ncbi:MAG: hypothetical protein GC171_01780 [Terrimonas sp.]|nr:hypothetical protein [Terrimonas sp.]
MIKKIPALFCFIFFIKSVTAQPVDSILARYGTDYAQEKCYLHFDKTNYAAGETIWFKAYLMEANYPAVESKTFYVDWTDEKGSLLYRSVLPLLDGVTRGQFDIPADFSGNFIHARAYTKWMLNFDSAFLFNRDIRVISAQSKKNNITSPRYDLQFFPEGGTIISGVNNRIAFMVNDQWGHPVKIRGAVKSEKGKLVDSLHIIHDGMGSFFLHPLPGEKYTVNWRDEKGALHSSDLPETGSSGVSLQVTVSGAKRNFQVTASPGGPSRVFLVGTMNQFMAFRVMKDLTKGPGVGTIPTEGLPSGVLTITVFDESWRPLAERVTFINNHEYRFEPKMTVEHWGLSSRGKNEVRIAIPDSMVASLSVAVTDADIETDSSNNIVSQLLLSSELKGYIHDPAFYFRSDADSVSYMLDLVMMTHGWRRISWQQVTAASMPDIKFDRDTSYLTVSGMVQGVIPSQLRDAGEIFLIVKQKDAEPKIVGVPIDKDGKFNDPSFVLFDSAQIYYQFSKKDQMANAQASFLQNRLPALNNPGLASGFTGWNVNDTAALSLHIRLASEAQQLRKFNELKTLENVTVKAKKKSAVEEMDEKYTSGLFSMGDAYQFDLVNDPFAVSRINIFSYLQGKVAGLQIIESGAQTSLDWRGGRPQLYIDEMQADVDRVSSLSVNDVAYIKVFRPPFIGGFGGGAGGAIAIYTRKGGDQKPEPGKGLASNKVTGYTISRQFYAPNYDSFNPENEKRDLRTTLYWNPDVILAPGQNETILRFYNNDVSRAFRVIIEGMSTDGRLTHLEQIME